ncbi:MAG: c-type cytochrome [Gemmatimonadales bacterium]|jgi:mono/diheme cytochrome c family protein|nr:MAG: c-type cytochrome [Gemmatimonadales bacterium]
MRRPLYVAIGVLSVAGLGGCAPHEFEPPDREQQVVRADAEFSLALFDTITWTGDRQRELEGNVVYSSYCRNCHGPLGRGGTEYAANRDLEVPSVVEPDWRFAEARDSILHQIFVGHAAGMPTWGVAGISIREMDAVTFYLQEILRPEILGEDAAGSGG